MNTTEKTFNNQAAQGDTLFRRVEKLPDGAKRIEHNGPVIVAHSETGHHHLFRDPTGVEHFSTDNPMVCYLRVSESALLEHNRDFDTHAPIRFKPGIYEVRRQREHTPEGWRMVQD